MIFPKTRIGSRIEIVTPGGQVAAIMPVKVCADGQVKFSLELPPGWTARRRELQWDAKGQGVRRANG